MKATDFKREHFANGKSFAQSDFDGYIHASEKLAKTMYTRYLPSLGGGVLVSLLFSQGVGGFIGNMMAVLCIFAGLIVGGVFNVKAGKAVKEYAAKLGVTNADVAVARQHVKNGTVAWCGVADETAVHDNHQQMSMPDRRYCASCGKELQNSEKFCVQCGAQTGPVAPVVQATPEFTQPEPELSEKPTRAVWAAGFMLAAWVALVILQCVFGFGARAKFAGTVFNADALMMSVAALIGTAAYLMTKPELKLRLFGGGIGLVTAVLNALSIAIMRNPQIYGPGVRLGELLSFRSVLFGKSLGGAFLFVLLALGAALLVSNLYKGGDKRRGLRLSALAASGVYLVCNLVNTFVNPHLFLGSMQAMNIVSAVMSAVADAAVLFLICTAVYALCNMKTERVKLRGIGLVWAWLAAAGAVVSLIAAISAGTSGNNGVITYTAQFVLAISALTGYILLLCKKRVGLYVILIGVGVMLGAQAMGALGGVMAGARQYTVLLISSLLGALNPLFAYLAVRAGTNVGASVPAAAAPVKNTISGFQKTAAVVCLIAGVVGILFPIVTMLGGERFVGGMAVYMLFGAAFAAIGAILMARQHSVAKAYTKGMRILAGIAFGFGVVMLLLSLGGIIAFLVM